MSEELKTSEERCEEAFHKYLNETNQTNADYKMFKAAWDAQEERVTSAVRAWYKTEIKNGQLSREACDKAGLDPFKLRPVMEALQYGEITVSRARECLGLWVAGAFNAETDLPAHNLVGVDLGEDEMPLEVIAKLRADLDGYKDTLKIISEALGEYTVVMQAAWIEWQNGKGAVAAMQWIDNTLAGPGFIPYGEYSDNAQFWFDTHRPNPFPKCWCGNPSHIAWMEYGYCSMAHSNSHQKRLKEEQEGKPFELESQVDGNDS